MRASLLALAKSIYIDPKWSAKEIKEYWLELFEVLIYLQILDNLLNNYNSFLTNFARNFRV